MGCSIDNSLIKLREKIEEGMAELGFASEKRGYSPHLTIGRIKYLRQTDHLSKIIADYKSKVFQEIKVTELIYYESKLRPSGSVYIPIQKFTFGLSQS
jgi:2'-5' RNA ligase